MIQEGTPVREILRRWAEHIGRRVMINGWVRTRRDSKAGISFVEVNDGSCLKNLQVIVDHGRDRFQEILQSLTTGASVSITGVVRRSPAKGQPVEVEAESISIVGSCDPASYPLQKKRHSFEFLREIAHLRPRTNTIGAVMRVRNSVSYAVHRFFQERGFYYIHTPIITTSDCEGAGEVFRVTAQQDPEFFGRPTYLTVSGQLQAEVYALALGKVYTFGPTFRAENSQTRRHLSEFWMIEPEMAFADLENDLALAQDFLHHVVSSVMSECDEELQFFSKFFDEKLLERLQTVAERPFEVVTYTEAISLLKKSGENFTYPAEWGCDLQAEHERYLTERVFNGPVAVIHFPRDIKPFYMKVNDDGRTVAAMDVLVAGVGEIIGGSEREYRYELLLEQMKLKGMNPEAYEWYLDLRKYGSVPHAGFGLGLERLIQFLTGVPNIRETIPFPRVPGYAFA
ncbi:asparagine--tRNA ligase [Thermodesulforhabdus norvegica]|uniref:Asparagine--tRNA ligase n=1 Tax=Thermodesulforhabdus norvegica TaxID=39841 RepID=A0A1I4RCX0_9BACT|nr:asparagine--tRNA ligase [Thermodesulforhabdus norvegica]SFM50101.1 asparaginyl-tRNA synthetase [Thermodesulforhabdus norvegica]